MFDVFYIGQKPGLFPHEQSVGDINQACLLSRTRFFWIINYLCDYSDWDWLWEPPPWQSHQRHAWRSQWHKDAGTYLIPKTGFQDTNYHQDRMIFRKVDPDVWIGTESVDIGQFDLSWHPDPTDPPYIYQFGTQWQKTGGPRYLVPGATEIKYVDTPRINKETVDANWENLHLEDQIDFDWTWHPDERDPPYIYQFGTQWQKTGGPRYLVPGATEIKYVDQIRVAIRISDTPAIVIDHLDGASQLVAEQVAAKTSVLRCSRFVNNYLDTLRRIANNTDHDGYLWICSSVCDYQDFDFTWHPEQWQASMLHVFASDDQKFGDTFLMHAPSFRDRSRDVKLLDWYDLNFVDTQSVPRRAMPVIMHDHDSQVTAVTTMSWSGPLAVFTVRDFVDQPRITVPLWRMETRAVTSLDPGGESVIVPRDAVSVIKSQIYDYPYIDRSQIYLQNDPLDIVFISNGEHGAEHHWNMLCDISRKIQNHVHRIDGVTGRVAAYQAAARASSTAWFFAVFAKLQVNEDFDWRWQPDRLQQVKHYIFHAYNPVNHLTYGHQAMIAYNRRLVLENSGQGLDFTLDQPHEVVPVVSGTAYFDNDPWTCWRTAFRECVKLLYSLPDVENDYRLQQWLSVGEGTNGHWSIQGANDAVNYYESVSGNFAALKKSYEWDWLASYAFVLHPELVTQSST